MKATESEGQRVPIGAGVLLFVHGDFGDGFTTWGTTCDVIGRRYRTVTIDRPGFNQQLGPADRFTYSGEATSVLEIADAIAPHALHLCGHSYGALIALQMAAMHPRRLRSLHLIEPPFFDLLVGDAAAQEMAQCAKSIQRQYEIAGDEKTTEAFFAMIGAAHVPVRLKGTPDWDRLCRHAARFARSEPAGDFSAGVLDRIPPSLPIALYLGGRSLPVLRATTRALSTRWPDARLIDIAVAGHAVQMAGKPFVDPLLDLVTSADAAWRKDN